MDLNQNQEIFRAISNCIDYEISTHGRVRNARTGLILKQCSKTYKSFLYVTISKNKIWKKCKIHQLVAEAFCNNMSFQDMFHLNGKKKVTHLNGNIRDNCYKNLILNNFPTNNKKKIKKINKIKFDQVI